MSRKEKYILGVADTIQASFLSHGGYGNDFWKSVAKDAISQIRYQDRQARRRKKT
jgi:hypothetical protein